MIFSVIRLLAFFFNICYILWYLISMINCNSINSNVVSFSFLLVLLRNTIINMTITTMVKNQSRYSTQISMQCMSYNNICSCNCWQMFLFMLFCCHFTHLYLLNFVIGVQYLSSSIVAFAHICFFFFVSFCFQLLPFDLLRLASKINTVCVVSMHIISVPQSFINNTICTAYTHRSSLL